MARENPEFKPFLQLCEAPRIAEKRKGGEKGARRKKRQVKGDSIQKVPQRE